MNRLVMISFVILGSVVMMPSLASAQKATQTDTAASDDPNDKTSHDRTFEETRAHMQAHSEWSKKTGKMSDN